MLSSTYTLPVRLHAARSLTPQTVHGPSLGPRENLGRVAHLRSTGRSSGMPSAGRQPPAAQKILKGQKVHCGLINVCS